MTQSDDVNERDLAQEATGEGYDPDQTWQDEPDDDDGDLLDDPDDRSDDEPEQEV